MIRTHRLRALVAVLVAAVLLVPLMPATAGAAPFTTEVERADQACTLTGDADGNVDEQCPDRPQRRLLKAEEQTAVEGWPKVVRRGPQACLQYVGVEGDLRERCPAGDRRMLEARWLADALGETIAAEARASSAAAEAAPAAAADAAAEAAPDALGARRPAAAEAPPAGPAYGDAGTWDGDLLLSLVSRPLPETYRWTGREQRFELDVGVGRFVGPGVRLWGTTGLTANATSTDAFGRHGARLAFRVRAGALVLLGGPGAIPRLWSRWYSGLGPFLAAGLELATPIEGPVEARPGGLVAAGFRGPILPGLGADVRIAARTGALPEGDWTPVIELKVGLFGFLLPK